jgi:lactate permease
MPTTTRRPRLALPHAVPAARRAPSARQAQGSHAMYQQVFDPVSHSLAASSLFAALPLAALFVLLGGLRWRAQWAGLAGLGVALLVAIVVYSMPVGQALGAGTLGAAFGLFPIMWIVVNPIWIYNLTVDTGHFAVLRRSFNRVSDDQRIQAIIVAFCFGALIEALAGFGTPVAISSVMLIAIGFKPVKAAVVALVANTAPVAFGAMAVPIITLASVTGLPQGDLAAMVGRQTPFLAAIVPLLLVAMVDGRRGLRQTWLAAVIGGAGFAIGQFACSNYLSVELTDIVASLLAAGSIVALLRVWSPAGPVPAETAVARPRPIIAGGSEAADRGFEELIRRRDDARPDSRRDVVEAYAPYLLIIAIFSIAQVPAVKDLLAHGVVKFSWPGLDVTNAEGEAVATTFTLNWLPSGGTLLALAGLLTMLVLRVRPGAALRTYLSTCNQLKWATVTVMAVLALAYVMNLSGQTITLGLWLAGAGSFFAFLSPIIGWLGVAVTGSDTSSNSLFGALQVTAAHNAGLSPTLMAAANSSGGVLGKMISPQNLAICAGAVGMAGREAEIFRKVVGWSLALLLAMCALVYLQSTAVLGWMVP